MTPLRVSYFFPIFTAPKPRGTSKGDIRLSGADYPCYDMSNHECTMQLMRARFDRTLAIQCTVGTAHLHVLFKRSSLCRKTCYLAVIYETATEQFVTS